MRHRLLVLACGTLALLAAGCGGGSKHRPAKPAPPPSPAVTQLPPPPLTGIHKIRHVVVIMQENRSFDEYFGTYRGADGIPGLAGNPGLTRRWVGAVFDPL